MAHNFRPKYISKRSLRPNLLGDCQPRSGFGPFCKLCNFPDVESDVIIRGVGFSEAKRDIISRGNGYPNVGCDIIVRRMTNPEVVFAFSEPFEGKPLVVFKNSACLCTFLWVVSGILGRLCSVPEVVLASHKGLMDVSEVVLAFSEQFEQKPLVGFKNSAGFEQKPFAAFNTLAEFEQKPEMETTSKTVLYKNQSWFLHFRKRC